MLEKNLLDASPNLIAEIQIESLDNSQVEKIRGILKLLKTLELKTNAKLNWFQDLDQHLKQSLAKRFNPSQMKRLKGIRCNKMQI